MGFDLLPNSPRRRLQIKFQPLSSRRRSSSMIVVASLKSRVITYCKDFVHTICHTNHISLLWPLVSTTLRAGDYLSGHLASLLSLNSWYNLLQFLSLYITALTMVLQSASPSSNIYLSRRTCLLYMLLYCCVNIMTKATRVRKGFFCLTIPHRRLSFRKVKSRAEAETIKKSCLPAYSPGSHSASFPMPFRTICLRVMLSTVGWILHH